jgi:hypothetical protein
MPAFPRSEFVSLHTPYGVIPFLSLLSSHKSQILRAEKSESKCANCTNTMTMSLTETTAPTHLESTKLRLRGGGKSPRSRTYVPPTFPTKEAQVGPSPSTGLAWTLAFGSVLIVLHQRKYQKERLAASFRIFAKLGFDEGVAGRPGCGEPRVRPYVQETSHILIPHSALMS